MSWPKRLIPGAAFVFYLLIALEAIIMITPFTVYFYAVYAPVLGWLEASAWTAWLTAFFLPHITYTGAPLHVVLAWLGPVLVTIGLLVFIVCAAQVYSAKLFRRGVVSGGLYRLIRHPQYVGLAVAGLGLLLYWPRFIILLLYLSMLFVYYLLARYEEGLMEARYGERYRRYLDSMPMFIPAALGGRALARRFAVPPGGAAVAVAYVGVLAVGLGLAFGARAYSLSHVPIVRYSESLGALSLAPASTADTAATLAAAVHSPEVEALLDRFHREPGHTIVAYVVPRAYMMQHLIADIGEHEAHHGTQDASGFWAVTGHLMEMYALKPFRQLRDGAQSPERRIIFTEARTPAGASVPLARALDADVLRLPLFLADVDGSVVTVAMETPRRHTWGTIPVPAF